MKRALAALALLAALAPGCMYARSQWGPADEELARIAPGRTTREDVLRLAGLPDRVIPLGGGEAWVWRTRSAVHVMGLVQSATRRDLVVLFDRNGLAQESFWAPAGGATGVFAPLDHWAPLEPAR